MSYIHRIGFCCQSYWTTYVASWVIAWLTVFRYVSCRTVCLANKVSIIQHWKQRTYSTKVWRKSRLGLQAPFERDRTQFKITEQFLLSILIRSSWHICRSLCWILNCPTNDNWGGYFYLKWILRILIWRYSEYCDGTWQLSWYIFVTTDEIHISTYGPV